jgi:hypothetical protein
MARLAWIALELGSVTGFPKDTILPQKPVPDEVRWSAIRNLARNGVLGSDKRGCERVVGLTADHCRNLLHRKYGPMLPPTLDFTGPFLLDHGGCHLAVRSRIRVVEPGVRQWRRNRFGLQP